MSKNTVYAYPNTVTPTNPVKFDPEICNGCNNCVKVCIADLFIPNPEKGKPPLVLYPEECWYEGACVEHCPQKGAIKLNHPLTMRVRWKRKDTAEHFRV